MHFYSVSDELFLEQTIDRFTKWTVEKGYEADAKLEMFPFRSHSSFSENGVVAILSGFQADIDPVCGDGEEGFKVLLSQ